MKTTVAQTPSAKGRIGRPQRPIEDPTLSIGEALIRWCAPDAVSRWRSAFQDLSNFRFERRLEIEIPKPETLKNAAALQALWTMNERALIAQCDRAHATLQNDLRWQLANGALFAQGFLASDGFDAERVLLPGARAGDFVLDPFKSIVVLGQDRYLSVAISRRPLAPTRTAPNLPKHLPDRAQPTPAPTLTMDTVANLEDDVLLKVVEVYLDRIAASPDAKLKEPGKFSLMPFVARKMRDRAQKGELLPTITTEAAWLEQWIASKIEGHPVPGAKNIGKVLGKEYALLKAQSNAATVLAEK